MEKEIKTIIGHQYTFYDRLMCVGKAMFDLYSCRTLSNEQIELLATASDEDKVMGMNIVADNRLTMNHSYNVYRRNTDAIRAVKLLKRTK